DVDRLHHFAHRVDVRARERAVARDIGVHEPGDAALDHLAGEIERANTAALQPAVGHHFAVTGVDGDDDAAREAGASFGDELGLADGSAAQLHAPGAVGKRSFDGFERADATGDFDRDADSSANRGHHLVIDGLTILRAVEVDNMDERCAGLLPLPRDAHGVVGVAGFAVVITLHEPHAAATAQVDCGDHLER